MFSEVVSGNDMVEEIEEAKPFLRKASGCGAVK
jgi:hypothetical protein